MTLDSFLNECKRKNMTAVSYKEITESLDGSRMVEYVNPEYAKAKEVIARVLSRGRQNNGDDNGIDGLISNLAGEQIVIKTKFGCHHGKLLGYDGKSFMLGDYLFSRTPMELMDYETEFFYGGDTIIPAKDIISISKIPDMIGEFT